MALIILRIFRHQASHADFIVPKLIRSNSLRIQQSGMNLFLLHESTGWTKVQPDGDYQEDTLTDRGSFNNINILKG